MKRFFKVLYYFICEICNENLERKKLSKFQIFDMKIQNVVVYSIKVSQYFISRQTLNKIDLKNK